MKRLVVPFTLMLGLGIAAGCSDDGTAPPVETYDFTSILGDYSANVVVATYTDMKAKGAALATAVNNLSANPGSQDALNAAADAWRGMREPWESSEAFLFGPADFLSLDPS